MALLGRQARRERGRSDRVDAEAIAGAVPSGSAIGRPKTRERLIEALRLHLLVYNAMFRDRTVMRNRLHGVVTSAPAEIRQQVLELAESAQIATIA